MIQRRVNFGLAGLSIIIFSILLLCISVSDFPSGNSSRILLEIQEQVSDSSLGFSPATSPVTYSQSSTVSAPGYQQHVVQIRKPVGMTLVPGALNYYKPLVKPTGPSVIDGDPMGQWGDIFQRVTGELTTDTMEIANLDNQV